MTEYIDIQSIILNLYRMKRDLSMPAYKQAIMTGRILQQFKEYYTKNGKQNRIRTYGKIEISRPMSQTRTK